MGFFGGGGYALAGTGVFSKLRSDSVSIWPAADQAFMTDESHRPALQLDSPEGIVQGGYAAVVDLARYRHEVPGLPNPSRHQRFPA
ncbi:hypothetical protein QM716_22315 [Rhodococcus sp. IEGM 1409]|uniref:hypothetical protein n=1 Tax=Rhodococcus sp. IEGM 1409 TaxID=3047082 RepID=UPI0024B6B657|nr:hypothetical protein [Rhodococcus sp. IEGM 1409]MDI9902594.1 hypothetical protein [Rhodococcus sp. IEGM 1409]